MDRKVLFVDCCISVHENSRTKRLAEAFLNEYIKALKEKAPQALDLRDETSQVAELRALAARDETSQVAELRALAARDETSQVAELRALAARDETSQVAELRALAARDETSQVAELRALAARDETSQVAELRALAARDETSQVAELQACGDGTIEVEHCDLQKLDIKPLTPEVVVRRNKLCDRLSCDKHVPEELELAAQFADADLVIIAAPYWEMTFPALLRVYIEHISALNVTFKYDENGMQRGLCKADRMIYITTAGGPLISDNDFGGSYMKAMCGVYGIPKYSSLSADLMDVDGVDSEERLGEAIKLARALARECATECASE